MLGLGSVGTLAAWSDSATATSNEFKTGKIDLKLGPEPGVDSYTFSAFNGSGLMPGSTVQAPLDCETPAMRPSSTRLGRRLLVAQPSRRK
ncbi:hypothetical protein GS496_19055 [Rhodococcus hoagii]|nr:hypothetical protein [Prescottella equi]